MKFDLGPTHSCKFLLFVFYSFIMGVVVGNLFPTPMKVRESSLGKKVLVMPLGSYLGRGIDYTDSWNYTTTNLNSDLNSDYTALTVGTGKTPEEAMDSAKPVEY